jgi:Fe-S cluster assembly iron-binding protein IscA
MLEITKSATDKISKYFIDKELKPIRIFLHAGECAPSSLALDVDEIKDTDTAFEIDGFQFIVDENLLKEAVSIKVDYNARSGFQFDSSLEFEDECSACECCC